MLYLAQLARRDTLSVRLLLQLLRFLKPVHQVDVFEGFLPLHVEVVEFDLADETAMLAPAADRYKALEYTVHYKRVILIANCDQVSMAGLITG